MLRPSFANFVNYNFILLLYIFIDEKVTTITQAAAYVSYHVIYIPVHHLDLIHQQFPLFFYIPGMLAYVARATTPARKQP